MWFWSGAKDADCSAAAEEVGEGEIAVVEIALGDFIADHFALLATDQIGDDVGAEHGEEDDDGGRAQSSSDAG